jgi:hypothetical protein
VQWVETVERRIEIVRNYVTSSSSSVLCFFVAVPSCFRTVLRFERGREPMPVSTVSGWIRERKKKERGDVLVRG